MGFFTEIHRFKADFEKPAHFSEILVLPSPQIRPFETLHILEKKSVPGDSSN